MVSFKSFLVASTAVIGTFAAPSPLGNNLIKKQTIGGEQGTNNGFFYVFWTDGSGDVTYTNGNGGSYSVVWSGGEGNWFGGKGWQTGSARTISYSADYRPLGNSQLSVYGYTTDPFVEYFIVENYGTFSPVVGGAIRGSVISDGGRYDIYEATQVNPGLENPIIHRYWSVRNNKRSRGTVTTKNHFDAWAAAGMELGTHNWQIVAVEGYYSSGSANVTVGGP